MMSGSTEDSSTGDVDMTETPGETYHPTNETLEQLASVLMPDTATRMSICLDARGQNRGDGEGDDGRGPSNY